MGEVLRFSSEKVRIRITKKPEGREFEAFSIWRFGVGRVYEVSPNLGKLLIVSGFAEPVIEF
jgi:hypothetical protein